MPNDHARLFFALWPDDALREQLAVFQRELPARSGKRVAVENLHVTLRFLGAVPRADLPALCDAAATLRAEPFTLALTRLGLWRKSGILWLGPDETPAPLLDLVRQLNRLPGPPVQPYQPHLTLLRKVAHQPPEFRFAPFVWRAQAFHLLESQTRTQGPEYHALASWPLHGAAD